MIPEFFLVAFQLLFHFMHRRMKTDHDIVACFMRYEIIVVFRVDQNLGFHASTLEVDSHFDGNDTVEIGQQFLSFFFDDLL